MSCNIFNQCKDSMLASVPASERDELERRIDLVVSSGWTCLGLYSEWDEETFTELQPHMDDLFGKPPDSPYCRFVGNPEANPQADKE